MVEDSEEQFEINTAGAQAIGELKEEGFLVREGSIARKDIVTSAINSVTPIHERLLSESDKGRLLQF